MRPDNPDVFFDAELRRDMALSRATYLKIMRVMMLVCATGGVALFLTGAWPVIGFLGLDILLIWGAFKAYERSCAKHYERVIVNRDGLTVSQHHGNARREINYEPTFLQVMANTDDNSQPIELWQRGKSLQIGRWIGPEERELFAARLKQALRDRQQALVGS